MTSNEFRPFAARAVLGTTLALVSYTYAVYPLAMLALVRRASSSSPSERNSGAHLPSLTVVVPALDEDRLIDAKVRDVLAQDYPGLDVLVVADGSRDRTVAIAAAAGARVLDGPGQGKAAAVNRGVAASTADVVVFTDANCALAPGALRALVAPFRDPAVAVVSGAKSVRGSGAHGVGEGLYWKLESVSKQGESVFGAVMGAVGELCAVRRSAFAPLPPGVINDDYHLALHALANGRLVRYAPEARTLEVVSSSPGEEFERRTRIAVGTWQESLRYRSLLDPRRGFPAVAFASHRVLRNLLVPLLLPVAALAVIPAARYDRLARAALAIGVVGLAAAGAGLGTDARWASVPHQFVVMNAAQVRGLWRFARRRQPLVWQRAERQDWSAFDEPAAGGAG